MFCWRFSQILRPEGFFPPAPVPRERHGPVPDGAQGQEAPGHSHPISRRLPTHPAGPVKSPRNFPGRGPGARRGASPPGVRRERSPPGSPAPPGGRSAAASRQRLRPGAAAGTPQRASPDRHQHSLTASITPGTDSQSYPAARKSVRGRSLRRRGGCTRQGSSENSNCPPPPPLHASTGAAPCLPPAPGDDSEIANTHTHHPGQFRHSYCLPPLLGGQFRNSNCPPSLRGQQRPSDCPLRINRVQLRNSNRPPHPFSATTLQQSLPPIPPVHTPHTRAGTEPRGTQV